SGRPTPRLKRRSRRPTTPAVRRLTGSRSRMKRLTNLRLGVRLGAAFAALSLALVLTTVVSVVSLSKLSAASDSIVDRDVKGFQELVTLSEDVLGNADRVVRHLYVWDGD